MLNYLLAVTMNMIISIYFEATPTGDKTHYTEMNYFVKPNEQRTSSLGLCHGEK
jgi:hypothetical protein